MEQPLQIQVSQESIGKLVEQQIRLAVMDAVGKNSNGLVQKLVDAALAFKVTRNYRERPFLEDALDEMIREEVKAGLKEWIENMPDRICRHCQHFNTEDGARGTCLNPDGNAPESYCSVRGVDSCRYWQKYTSPHGELAVLRGELRR